ncbi:MAG: carotenoid oxygenase family protein, partial [Brevundimonas sp.]
SNTHFLNAWQDGDTIVVDGNRAPYMGTPKSRIDQPIPRQWFQPATPWRWTLDVAARTYRAEQTTDVNSEFPRMNDAYCGKKARYGYLAATKGPEFLKDWFFDHIIKHDLQTGEAEFFNPGHGLTAPGEMVFIPRADAKAEDDGWIVGPWWNMEEDRTEFVILDAQSLSTAARIQLPYRMPLGFHGNWIAD